jgi:hypothetical protein
MKVNLDRIENRLRDFIENKMFFPRRENSLPQQLVNAMQAHLSAGPNGVATAPSNYVLSLNARALPWWQANPEALDRLASELERAAQECGLSFLSPPSIRLSVDNSLPPDGLHVSVTAPQSHGSTAAIPVQPAQEFDVPEALPEGAFLIINGVENVPLRQGVINIGRRLENHIIINDARVSRSHAQLRAVRGHYILFDLNSSGGTFVNGLRVTQHTLRPGDVISLAGVPIIYGQETHTAQSDTTALPTAK